MKFIAKRGFANVPAMKRFIRVEELTEHPGHIQKWHRFEIGTAVDFNGLSDNDKELVAHLFSAQVIGEAANKEVVAKVEAEIEADKKRAAADAKLNAKAAGTSVIDALTALLAKALAAPAK